MKAYIIQPHYSTDYKEIDDCIKEELSLIAACDAAADIIVLPECCDVLAAVPSDEDFIRASADPSRACS